jgi:hypothetical protein
MRAAELRREIAERRDGIGRDLEVIGDRVSPARMADRTRERTRRRVSGLRDRVMGPADSAKSTFGDSSGHQSVGERVGGAASSISDRDPVGAVSQRVEGSPLAMGLVAFGIGFVAGSVIPQSRSEQQLAHRLEPQVSQLAEAAAETVRDAAEHLAPAAQEEVATLKDEARRAVDNVADTGRQEMEAARQEAAQSST